MLEELFIGAFKFCFVLLVLLIGFLCICFFIIGLKALWKELKKW